MFKVYGVHKYEFELKPGITKEEYEKFSTEVMTPAMSLTGMKWCLLKGIKGERKGKYAGIYIVDDVDVYNDFCGGSDKENNLEKFPKECLEAIETFFTMVTSFTDEYTDYQVVE